MIDFDLGLTIKTFQIPIKRYTNVAPPHGRTKFQRTKHCFWKRMRFENVDRSIRFSFSESHLELRNLTFLSDLGLIQVQTRSQNTWSQFARISFRSWSATQTKLIIPNPPLSFETPPPKIIRTHCQLTHSSINWTKYKSAQELVNVLLER